MRLKRGTGFLIGTARAVMTIAQSVLVAELRISWRGGNSRHVATQKALEICGAKHDHVTRGAFTGFDGYLEKLPTQMAGGTGADIVQLNWPWLPKSLRDGKGFVDVHRFSGLDSAQWSDTDLESGSVNGVLQGISVPTIWAELETAIKLLKDKLGDGYYTFNAHDTAPAIFSVLEAILIQAAMASGGSGRRRCRIWSKPARNQDLAQDPWTFRARGEWRRGYRDH